MSASTLEQKDTQTPIKQTGLPLQTNKQPSFKIIGVIVLFVLIAMANYFFFNRSDTKKEVKVAETFTAPVINPVSDTNQPNKTDVRPDSQTVTSQADMQKALAEAKAKDFIERMQASQQSGSAVSSSSYTTAPTASSNYAPQNGEISSNGFGQAKIDDPNTTFLMQASNSKAEHVYATHFGALPYIIGQGKFIFANLAVAINSDLPGQITAIVSQDLYGEQGRKILIPRGSRLIGEYKSGLVNNQGRLFVVWTRLREPNGIDIMLGSEGTDALGRAGVTGSIDYHFLARFGTASLIAMIGAGTATIGVNPSDQYNSAANYRQQVAEAMGQQATNTLNQSINIPPTINVPQGQKIVVFVNKDLDFSGVMR